MIAWLKLDMARINNATGLSIILLKKFVQYVIYLYNFA